MNIPDLSSYQAAKLENLLSAGFAFATIARIERHMAVEKDGFVALLDLSEGEVQIFGQVGYRMGEGIGMLVERRGEKAFVWKEEALFPTPELLAAYERIKAELGKLLERIPEETEGGTGGS
jgi:hypothetical protein